MPAAIKADAVIVGQSLKEGKKKSTLPREKRQGVRVAFGRETGKRAKLSKPSTPPPRTAKRSRSSPKPANIKRLAPTARAAEQKPLAPLQSAGRMV